MKRFYKNTLISRVSNSTLRVVALLCVLLGVSSSAWADTGFHKKDDSNKVFSFKFEHSGTWYNYETTGQGEVSLGDFEYGKHPKLQEFYYRTYKTAGDNVCLGKVYAKINGNLEEIGIVDQNVNNYGDNGDNNNKYYYQEWKKWETKDVLPKTIGKHTFYLQIKVPVGNSCNGEIATQEYKFTYTIKDPGVYLGGNASYGDNGKYEPLEYYTTNVYRYKLKGVNQWFRLSDKDSENVSFTNKTLHKDSDDKGATLKVKTDANGPYEFEANISNDQLNEGYSEPIYFYYNKSTKYCWVEATKKVAYTLEFKDGAKYSCTDLNDGEICVKELELEEGDHKFRVYKNGVAYYYFNNGTNHTFKEELKETSLTKGEQWSTIRIEKLGKCTFTISGDVKLKVDYEELKEPVLLSYNPIISADNKTATLSAYLQGTLCTSGGIAEYGFVFCSGGNGCVPTKTSTKKVATGLGLGRGDDFDYTATTENDEFLGGVTYGYRAYVKIGNETYLSRETNYFRLEDDCVPQPAGQGVVKFTIDASYGEDYENNCKLIYGSLQTAINKLRDSYKDDDELDAYVTHETVGGHDSYNLNQPVEFNVKYVQSHCHIGTYKAVVSGGGDDSRISWALIFKDFNRNSNANINNTLTIKGYSDQTETNVNNRPRLHHVILRNSRNIILDNLLIISDPSGKVGDDALEFDLNDGSFWDVNVGDRDHNVLVKNCMIGSSGFTGLHASGYDGITFENNEFEAVFDGSDGNAVGWGASAKFMMCQNIKFIRNNFRGAHATLVWLQECQNVLFMNNVFWNTNQYDHSGCSAIRVVAQYNREITKHGFYYNTFFLANNDNNEKYNFLCFDNTSNPGGGSKANFYEDNLGAVEFMYNNCYSYDTDVPGRNTDPFLGLESEFGTKFPNICNNNFWSLYDQKIWEGKGKPADYNSAFEFGCNSDFTNVSELVCKTTASGPASLVVKGGGDLNKGVLLTVDGIKTATNQTVDPKEVKYDRYNANVRPKTNLTYGAYQGKEASTLQADSETGVPTIYWVGVTEKWDDRNNWAFFSTNDISLANEGPQARSGLQLQRLSCLNNLPENLKVVITETPAVVLKEGERKWPQLPSAFDSDTRSTETITDELPEGIPAEEQVSAGTGVIDTPTKFADNIELEYGAAIKGIEHLVVNEVVNEVNHEVNHYGSATVNFTAPRDGWILVGTIVKPFENGTSGNTRNIISNDYFLNHLPKVQMHQIETKISADASAFVWEDPFASLYVEVEPYDVFAISLPDAYGQYGLPAVYYNKKYSTSYNPKDPVIYNPFVGRFVNENGNHPIEFTSLTKGQWNLLNNSYPCNIDAKELVRIAGGELQYYDGSSFKPLTGVQGDVLLKPQHGFIYKPTSDETLTITKAMLADGNTRSRSAEVEMPTFSLNLVNANTKTHNSNIAIRYDEFLGEGNVSENNVEKVFATSVKETPELYIIANDTKLASMDVATEAQTIPLGVRIKQPMNIRFEKAWFSGYKQVTLLDKVTGEEYDLTTETYTTKRLEVGDIEGRFFLNLEEGVKEEELPEEGGDVSTEIEDNTSTNAEINIMVEESDNTIRVITNGVELKTIYVSDMSGRTMKYNVRGCAVHLKLPISEGVYLVNVIGDTASRTGKVILK